MTYERENIQRMAGYQPGEQPDDDRVLKLNTNENPWPPSPAAMAALQQIAEDALRRYPSPTAAAVRHQAARLHGVSTDQIVTTNGGDELLRLAMTTFVPPGAPIGIAEPSYSLYPVLAAIHDSPIEAAELDAQWSLPDDFAERMNAAGVPLTLIVNPHAPSGHLLPAARISQLAAALDGVLLVDEAYVDFAPADHDVVGLIARHDNLLVLRTLSKGYGLAGLRLGYGIGAPGLIAPIAEKTRDSYSVDAVADAVGAAALADQDHARSTWQAVCDARGRLTRALEARGFTVPESATNFCLATRPPDSPLSAAAIKDGLKARGILIRHFDTPRLADKIRISVGTPEQNDRLITALDEILAAAADQPAG
ncbi:histidinol-phosphate transaminase [Spiribacter pallidus]|uniref:Histidinol-phosphate aminotransferase n=1 Tax=Spiribacter pallidus TaxID=1987936 RepID=A0ABV3TB02_9GAMM